MWRELTEWHREISQEPTIGGEHPEDYFDKHLADIGPDQLWVAVHDFNVVGLVGLILKGDEAEIEPLIVNRAYRRKGIGKQLIETVISKARNKGARLLNIGPVARNIKAIQWLYKRASKISDTSKCSWTSLTMPGSQDPKFSAVSLTSD